MKKELWIHDYEFYKNVSLFGYLHPKTGEKKIFELSDYENNSRSHKKFIGKRVKGLIGFNNLGYDSHLLDYHLRTKITNPAKYKELSDNIIKRNSPINKSPIIPQLDIFKVNHWDNSARMTSLKAAEARMNFHNISDLPYHHDAVLRRDQIKKLRKYLVNDLKATLEVYNLYENKYYLRSVLRKEYNIPCTNWSDSKIGEELLLKLYCEYTDQDPDDVRNLRTKRNKIIVKDIVFPYISFETKQLKKLLVDVKSEIIVNTKGGFKHVFEYGGIETHLAQGGIHSKKKKGIFKNSEDRLIVDIDVGAMYPSIIVHNKLYPEHLGIESCYVLRDNIVKPRKEIHKPKSKDDSLHYKQRKLHAAFSDGLKLAGNSVYGKSNDKYSFLEDPQMTMAVTINGQLMLMMCAEMIYENLSNVEIIQQNTDGITFVIDKTELDKFKNQITKWESITGLDMEYNYPNAIYQRDVNNYIWDFGSYQKMKGAYEVDKVVGSEPSLHKDNSMRIVALAAKEYFINGISVEKTILNHENIYDFCINTRAKKAPKKGKKTFGYQATPNSNIFELRQVKTIRYYISKSGGTIWELFENGSKSYREAFPKSKKGIKEINDLYKDLHNEARKENRWRMKLFNKYKEKEIEDYNIDYSYYIREANKLINAIEK